MVIQGVCLGSTGAFVQPFLQNPMLIFAQDKLPEGATVLGAVLSSDKMQLTSMTGNHRAHPLLISLANINMEFRTKACHHAFLLLALLPIAKFVKLDF